MKTTIWRFPILQVVMFLSVSVAGENSQEGVLASPLVYTFEATSTCKIAKCNYRVKNNTNVARNIEDIRLSCTCQKVAISSHRIPPNGSVDIELSVQSQAKVGQVLGTAYVVLDGNVVLPIQYKGEFYIKKDSIIPSQRYIGFISNGSVHKTVFSVSRSGGGIVGDISLSSSGDWISVKEISHRSSDERRFFMVEASEKYLTGDSISGTVSISPRMKGDSISVDVKIWKEPATIPSSLLVVGEDSERMILLVSEFPETMNVERVELSVPCVGVSIVSGLDDGYVGLRFSAGKECRDIPVIEGDLRIYLVGKRIIRVPFMFIP